jgi:nitrogen fixation protein NifB
LRGAGLLIEHQREAIRKLKEKEIAVHINTVIVPGINDAQIPALAKELAELGVDSMNCLPMIPVKGDLFEGLAEPDQIMMARVRLQAGEHVSRLSDCGGCHAKAFAPLEISDQEQRALLKEYAQKGAEQRARPCIAVATSDGATVNQPLGEAPRFLLFAPDPKAWSGFSFQEMRIAPKTGSGVEHWKALAETLYDCHSILVSAAGIGPRAILDELGIRVVEMKEGPVAEGLAALFAGKPIPEELLCATSGCSSGGCGGGRGRKSGACYN